MPFLNDQLRDQNGGPRVDGSPVNRTGTFDTAAVLAGVAQRLLGQPAALASVERALVIAQAGVGDRRRPLASVLLVGPTGVGKTELVRALAAHLRTGPDDLCRIDMGQLAQEHYAASLSGAPPGYAGSRESLSLFDKAKIEGGAFQPGIVLFDEVEKAHPVVLRALLGLLDHGELTLAGGQRSISFRNAFVFLTSNLGSREIADRHRAGWRRVLDRAQGVARVRATRAWTRHRLGGGDAEVIDRALRTFFEPEFLNRLDEIVRFTAISPAVATGIVELRLREVQTRLARRRVRLRIEDGAVRVLTDLGFDPVHGARAVNRAIRQHVVVPVAHALVAHRATGADTELTVSLRPAPSDTGPSPALAVCPGTDPGAPDPRRHPPVS